MHTQLTAAVADLDFVEIQKQFCMSLEACARARVACACARCVHVRMHAFVGRAYWQAHTQPSLLPSVCPPRSLHQSIRLSILSTPVVHLFVLFSSFSVQSSLRIRRFVSPSVRRSVRQSVCPNVRRSVGRSVGRPARPPGRPPGRPAACPPSRLLACPSARLPTRLFNPLSASVHLSVHVSPAVDAAVNTELGQQRTWCCGRRGRGGQLETGLTLHSSQPNYLLTHVSSYLVCMCGHELAADSDAGQLGR